MASTNSLTDASHRRRTMKRGAGPNGGGTLMPSSPGPSTASCGPRRPARDVQDPPPPRRRPPKNAVVAIKIEDGKSTYAEILKCAKERINIKELGITNLRIRRTVNGGVLMEIPGPDGQTNTDKLASRLKNEVGGGVKISRPTKFGEIRVSGIDVSLTPADLAKHLAASGHCEPLLPLVRSGTL